MRKTRSMGNIKTKADKTEEKKKPEEDQKYEFTNKTYSKYLNCLVCKILMKNPMRVHPCSHTFC
jgi:hypothetical protein